MEVYSFQDLQGPETLLDSFSFYDHIPKDTSFLGFSEKRNTFAIHFGVWRSWLAHLLWEQRVPCSSHGTPTQELEALTDSVGANYYN